MLRAASVALLLASVLAPALEAQRVGAGFRAFSGVRGQWAHIGQRGFSSGYFPGRFHPGNGLGAFLSPYFLSDEGGTLSEEAKPEPEPQVYGPLERERPPAAAQVIEIPTAGKLNDAKPLLPALFVLTNGERLEAQRFMLTVSSLSVTINRRERVIPLEALDLDATTAANRERGINLQIPADRNEISLSF